MFLTDLSIKRPVVASVMSIVLVIFGIITFQEIPTDELPEVQQIGVPESSVTIQGKTAFVYVVNGETVDKKNIQIGKRNFGKVSVLDGLSEGDRIVVEGVSKVRDKSKIKIIKQKNR